MRSSQPKLTADSSAVVCPIVEGALDACARAVFLAGHDSPVNAVQMVVRRRTQVRAVLDLSCIGFCEYDCHFGFLFSISIEAQTK